MMSLGKRYISESVKRVDKSVNRVGAVYGFFVTLLEIAIFLYIKAVWEIEEKLGYDIETVLTSPNCYKLLQ